MRGIAASLTVPALLAPAALALAALPQATDSGWAFRELRKPPVPIVTSPRGQLQNPIDAFLLAKLRARGLGFARKADHRTLIRRLYFDLIGLPPSPANLDEPYEKVVDRLLASPRYGERWGRHWLDIVRFGETDGGEHNYERFHAWPYRDYVIDAFNRDVPYDQFVRDQIAGDILSPNDRRKVAATGFLVAGPWDQVSVVLNKDPTMRKIARMDELDDMVTTVSATFLGLTVNCARCHDHKFDPIPTRDYYRLAAVFSGAGFGERNVATPPEKEAYEARVSPLRTELSSIERELSKQEEPIAPRQLLAHYRYYDASRRGDRQRIPLNPIYNRNQFPPVTARHFRMVITGQVSGKPRIDQFELPPGRIVATDWSAGEPASLEQPAILAIDLDRAESVSEITWSTDRKTGSRDGMVTIYRFEYSEDGKEWKPLCSSTDHVSSLEADLPTLPEEELTNQLNAEQRARRAELQKRRVALREEMDRIPPPPRIYAVNPQTPEKAFLLERGSVSKPIEELSPGALTCVRSLSPDLGLPTAAANDRPTKDKVDPRVLLAGWITNPRNPLTARVIVNRVWYYHFGTGIVNTPSDFGRMGDPPSHPELLDWLAVSFMEHGWSLKWLHRQILTSQAYQQSSTFSAKSHAIDAGNRLVWRMPLKRMDAETLRDSILQITGSLDLKAGGPSFLLQKKGDRGSYIYKALDNDGPEVWRRAVYRFIVRGGERIMMDSFDCPDPSVTTPQRQVSNTPVQALTLMNNAFLLKQAGLYARRLEREAPGNSSAQIRRAYLLTYGRPAVSAEVQRALRFTKEYSLALFCRALLNSNEFVYVP